MAKKKELVRVCGYQKDASAECGYISKIFEVEDGKLPDGWKDSPASFKKDK